MGASSRGHKERIQQYAARPPSGSFPQPQTVPAPHYPPTVYVSPAVAAAAVTDRVETPPQFPPRVGSNASMSSTGSGSGHHNGADGAPRSHHSYQPGHVRRAHAHANGGGVGVTPLATDVGSAAMMEPPTLLANGNTSRQSGGRNTPR